MQSKKKSLKNLRSFLKNKDKNFYIKKKDRFLNF